MAALPSVRDLARVAQAAFNAEQDRWFLWAPVALACGIGLYFWLPVEPGWALAAVPVGLGLATAVLAGPTRAGLLALAAALGLAGLGLVAAKIRTETVAGPRIDSKTGPVAITGYVDRLEPRGSGRVMVALEVVSIDGFAPDRTPVRVRLTTARAHAPEAVGEAVSLFAMLLPPPRPVEPGAYDFGRRAFFEGLGAYGYTLAPARPAELPARSWPDRAGDWLERLSERVAARVIEVVPDRAGAIAAALLTGKRGAIGESDLEAIRDSGLAHLLAISGLHMALMSGAAFWAVRYAFALIPWLGLRTVGRKWAAGAGLVTGFGYFLLAGGSVATERAFIMVAIALAAVMLDRPALSLRNVALAALAVLLARPETLLEAGFQMSFGAVVALAAFYEWYSARSRRLGDGTEPGDGQAPGPAGLAFRAAVGIALTTLIASLATGPLAAFHFNRVAVYGLAANLVAVPLVGFVIMPLGLLALVAMPFGLDGPVLQLMGAGTGYVVEVAHNVAGWPGAVSLAASPGPASLPLFAMGGLWLCLWRRRWRLLGLAPIAVAIGTAATAERPDVIAGDEGKRIAVRLEDGRLALSDGRSSRYEAGQWLRRDGDMRDVGEATGAGSAAGGVSCDTIGCAAILPDGRRLAYVRHPAALEDCRQADIVVAAIPTRGRCRGPAVVIDRFDLWRNGAHAVSLGPDGVRVVSVAGTSGHRPWHRHFGSGRGDGGSGGGAGSATDRTGTGTANVRPKRERGRDSAQ